MGCGGGKNGSPRVRVPMGRFQSVSDTPGSKLTAAWFVPIITTRLALDTCTGGHDRPTAGCGADVGQLVK